MLRKRCGGSTLISTLGGTVAGKVKDGLAERKTAEHKTEMRRSVDFFLCYPNYKIQCHILFRKPSSFQSHAVANPYHGSANNGNGVYHRLWNMWKCCSGLQALDKELWRNFGWQMDALDDGRGVAFPSAWGLESW